MSLGGIISHGSFYLVLLPLPGTFCPLLFARPASFCRLQLRFQCHPSESLPWPLILKIPNISACFIFFRAFIMIRNSLVQNFIFCLPTLSCKSHDSRNYWFTTSVWDYDTFGGICTFLLIVGDLSSPSKLSCFKLGMKNLEAILNILQTRVVSPPSLHWWQIF